MQKLSKAALNSFLGTSDPTSISVVTTRLEVSKPMVTAQKTRRNCFLDAAISHEYVANYAYLSQRSRYTYEVPKRIVRV